MFAEYYHDKWSTSQLSPLAPSPADHYTSNPLHTWLWLFFNTTFKSILDSSHCSSTLIWNIQEQGIFSLYFPAQHLYRCVGMILCDQCVLFLLHGAVLYPTGTDTFKYLTLFLDVISTRAGRGLRHWVSVHTSSDGCAVSSLNTSTSWWELTLCFKY